MSNPRITAHFSERAKTYDEGNWVQNPSLLTIHSSLAGDVKNKKLLDAACGTGILGERFVNKCAMVVGVDIAPEMLVQASERLNLCVLGDICHLPFLPKTFDLVFCRQGLHYVEPTSALGEFNRVLKNNGYLLVSSIIPYSDEDLIWFSKRTQIKKPDQFWVPTMDSLFEILDKSGFTYVKSITTQTCSKLSRSLNRTEHEKNVREEVFEHHINASASIKKLYKMHFEKNDIKYWINWVVALFQVS